MKQLLLLSLLITFNLFATLIIPTRSSTGDIHLIVLFKKNNTVHYQLHKTNIQNEARFQNKVIDIQNIGKSAYSNNNRDQIIKKIAKTLGTNSKPTTDSKSFNHWASTIASGIDRRCPNPQITIDKLVQLANSAGINNDQKPDILPSLMISSSHYKPNKFSENKYMKEHQAMLLYISKDGWKIVGDIDQIASTKLPDINNDSIIRDLQWKKDYLSGKTNGSFGDLRDKHMRKFGGTLFEISEKKPFYDQIEAQANEAARLWLEMDRLIELRKRQIRDVHYEANRKIPKMKRITADISGHYATAFAKLEYVRLLNNALESNEFHTHNHVNAEFEKTINGLPTNKEIGNINVYPFLTMSSVAANVFSSEVDPISLNIPIKFKLKNSPTNNPPLVPNSNGFKKSKRGKLK